MTDAQIKAVMHHLYDHEVINQHLFGRKDLEDNDWRHGETEFIPQWVSATFSEWLIAFRTEDWAELAMWMPTAKIKTRNSDIDTVMKIRAMFKKCEKAKPKRLRGEQTPTERAATKLGMSASAVSRGVKRADKYEADSQHFWQTLLAKHS
jgi:hypothetical protein